MTEEEDPQEEATRNQAPQEAHWAEETRFPPDLTCPLTSDPFPAPTMRNQWGTSPTSSMEIEPRQKHSLTNSTTTSYLTSTFPGLTPQLKRSPSLSRLLKGPMSQVGRER